jgi:hypothetical protein
MLCREIITERKKKGKKKTKAKLGKYFYPGFAYYGGSGEADTGGGDGGGESMYEGEVVSL